MEERRDKWKLPLPLLTWAVHVPPRYFILQSWRGREPWILFLYLCMAYGLGEPQRLASCVCQGSTVGWQEIKRAGNGGDKESKGALHTQLLFSGFFWWSESNTNLMAPRIYRRPKTWLRGTKSQERQQFSWWGWTVCLKYIYTTCHSKSLSSSLWLQAELVVKLLKTQSWSNCWCQLGLLLISFWLWIKGKQH